jgi:filamentous hemagglutinin
MTPPWPTLMVPPYPGPVVPGIPLEQPSVLGNNIYQSKVIQTGGHTIKPETARKLNEYFGLNLHPREWGRALEALKREWDLPNNHHGEIHEDGTYTENKGKRTFGNLADYLP